MLSEDVVDVTLQRVVGAHGAGGGSHAIATLNNGGAVATLPRSSLANRNAPGTSINRLKVMRNIP